MHKGLAARGPTGMRTGLLLATAGLWLAACANGLGVAGSTTAAPTTTSRPPATTTTAPPTSTTPTTTTLPPATTTTSVPESTTTTQPAWWRAISPEDPLRVWVIGDSLGGPLGGALRALTEGSALRVIAVDYEPGSGLVTPFFIDWSALVAARLPEVAPEVIICMLGANDGQEIRQGETVLDFRTPEWDAAYTDLVGSFMDQLGAGARRVYWVGPPIMADPARLDYKVRHIIPILRDQAALRLDVRLIDAYPLFQDASGQYAESLPDANGNVVVMRDEDGIHFTYEGAAFLAQHVLAAVLDDWER